jgi:hypothetical protein
MACILSPTFLLTYSSAATLLSIPRLRAKTWLKILTSKNLAVHLSMQTASPLSKSPSWYRWASSGAMHFLWHEPTRRLLHNQHGFMCDELCHPSSYAVSALHEESFKPRSIKPTSSCAYCSINSQDIGDHVELGSCHLDLCRVNRAGISFWQVSVRSTIFLQYEILLPPPNRKDMVCMDKFICRGIERRHWQS